MGENTKEKFMKIALEEARKGIKTTFPNPAVGAVIVKDGKILSTGYHKKAGEDHAEIVALKKIDYKGEGCDIYVTLEPCNHYGKTPPCTEAIIKSGIKKVFISVKDPNPIVDGSGIDRLKKAGIEVETSVLEQKGRDLLKYYFHQTDRKLPFVTLKGAVSLNGFINKNSDKRTIITGEEIYKFTTTLREKHQIVVVGANTIEVDNPTFKGSNIAILGDFNQNKKLNIFNKDRDILWFLPHSSKNIGNKNFKRVKKIPFEGEKISILDLLKTLYDMGYGSIFVEGGNKVFNQFIEDGYFNQLYLYIAPKIFSNGIKFYDGKSDIDKNLKISKVEQKGEDIFLRVDNVYWNYKK